MRVRCGSPASKSYKNYGGRGIFVCPEWASDFLVFRAWALSNGYQADLEIDRIDNDGPYAPTNCRFVTRIENRANRRDSRRTA